MLSSFLGVSGPKILVLVHFWLFWSIFRKTAALNIYVGTQLNEIRQMNRTDHTYLGLKFFEIRKTCFLGI